VGRDSVEPILGVGIGIGIEGRWARCRYRFRPRCPGLQTWNWKLRSAERLV